MSLNLRSSDGGEKSKSTDLLFLFPEAEYLLVLGITIVGVPLEIQLGHTW